jgi:hypothetical protein
MTDGILSDTETNLDIDLTSPLDPLIYQSIYRYGKDIIEAPDTRASHRRRRREHNDGKAVIHCRAALTIFGTLDEFNQNRDHQEHCGQTVSLAEESLEDFGYDEQAQGYLDAEVNASAGQGSGLVGTPFRGGG